MFSHSRFIHNYLFFPATLIVYENILRNILKKNLHAYLTGSVFGILNNVFFKLFVKLTT